METKFPRELQRLFERAVATGEFSKGEILTCSGLAERLGTTTDAALAVLRAEHRKGLVARQDRGEFEVLGLADPLFDSVFTHTSKSGLKPTSDIRVTVIEPATPMIAERLCLEVGAPVYRFERTRYANGEALANQINYIPFEVCPGLEHDDFSHSSFQKVLEEKYLVIFTDINEDFEIIVANEQDRAILNLLEGSSILVVQRVALGVTGYPLVWANIRIRPDRYQYVAELWPSAATLLAKDTP